MIRHQLDEPTWPAPWSRGLAEPVVEELVGGRALGLGAWISHGSDYERILQSNLRGAR